MAVYLRWETLALNLDSELARRAKLISLLEWQSYFQGIVVFFANLNVMRLDLQDLINP
jgi:hypothetical protein